MNYQFLSYMIYVVLLVPTVLFVGLFCYSNGKVFILHFAKDDLQISNQVNYLLLVGYYLLVIGLVIFRLAYWNHISTFSELIQEVCQSIGGMLLVIGGLHFFNLLSIQFYFNTFKS